ncbi:hypothetical protein D1007_29546 [Hordeum vulgare]|nr:hypothetical protein D1007_29546 [Hordeum vulgare]
MSDDLINKIVKNDNTDDDFVRMTFLVLLGTVIAPVSHEYIPMEYYDLVKDKRMISKFNWNDFTLKFFLSEIGKVIEDGRVREWPHGNLALLQYAYWEKVQPIIGPKYNLLSLMSPLMRNWTEPVVDKRDKYDYDYGRGVGMIDDNITYEYRVKKIAQEQAEKNKKSSTKKSTRMIEKMDKTGVFYRTGNMEEEEENLYGDINESTNDGAFGHKEFVYQSHKDNYRTPSQGKINKQKDDDEGNVPYYCTPEYLNSFKGDWSDPIEVPEVSHEKAVTSLDTNEISSHESGHYNGVDEQVEKGIGKCKRTASRAINSPFVVVKPIKRANFLPKRTYMALNKDNTHWVTVVMHKEKKEFQVLDSLMGKELDSTTRKLVEDLRREIGEDIAEANATGSVQYPDVSTWPTKTYDLPQQEDGNSCGLFVLHCFKNWNGDTWDRSFSQRSIDGSRELMIGQLIFALKNTLGEIKDKVIRIARTKK